MTRVLYFVVLLIVSWCVMLFTHEMGHLIGGWCSGGALADADLLPWHLPYSIFDPDPLPLVTLWCGPILGVALPVAAALIFRSGWLWFVANFCVVANGAYIAAGWFAGGEYIDTTKLLEHGAHPVTILLYCTLTIGFGYVGFRRSCVRVFRKPTATAPNSDVDARR
jgi:hypothetical protein